MRALGSECRGVLKIHEDRLEGFAFLNFQVQAHVFELGFQLLLRVQTTSIADDENPAVNSLSVGFCSPLNVCERDRLALTNLGLATEDVLDDFWAVRQISRGL